MNKLNKFRKLRNEINELNQEIIQLMIKLCNSEYDSKKYKINMEQISKKNTQICKLFDEIEDIITIKKEDNGSN